MTPTVETKYIPQQNPFFLKYVVYNYCIHIYLMLFGNMVICLKVVVIIMKNIDQVVLTYLQSSLLYYVGMQVD